MFKGVVKDLGHIPYAEAWALQKSLFHAGIDQKLKQKLPVHHLLLCEHPHVYTLGKSADAQNLLISKADLAEQNIDVFDIERGGDITYHGPGQRIIYPIIDLNKGCNSKDLKLYISKLEKWIILTLAEFKIQAFTIPGKIGIWVKNSKNVEAKIASIGLRIRKWVVYHGISINIHTNLEHYSGIIACGINNFPITSLKEIGLDISLEEFDIILKKKFIEKF